MFKSIPSAQSLAKAGFLAGLAGFVSLASFAPMPAQAQNWEVRPAPAHWGLPSSTARPASPQVAPQAAPQAAATPITQTTQSASANPSYQQALSCAAAIQLAALAAPRWASEPGVAAAGNRWLERAFSAAETAGVSGDQVRGAVQSEMNRQAELAGSDPSALSRRAFDCTTQASQ